METSLTCIAIDDDDLMLHSYEAILHPLEWLTLINTFNRPVNAATTIIDVQPDVIFLDLNMPHIEGNELLQWMEPKLIQLDYHPKVILVSANEELRGITHPLILGHITKQDFVTNEGVESLLATILER